MHCFPPPEAFKSSLKGDVDIEIYVKCKLEFERRINLPADDPNKWHSFVCYLKYYNLSDVFPASLALINQFNAYQANFNVYPMQSFGLPSFAKKAMFKMYDKTCSNVFSFPSNSKATAIFRKQIIGGLCNVYKRHVTLTDESSAEAAKYNKKGSL